MSTIKGDLEVTVEIVQTQKMVGRFPNRGAAEDYCDDVRKKIPGARVTIVDIEAATPQAESQTPVVDEPSP